jgi:hypothetical protein
MILVTPLQQMFKIPSPIVAQAASRAKSPPKWWCIGCNALL